MGMSVIKATGRQGWGAIITAVAYFALGIPISYYCAFVQGADVRGLWVGPTVAVAWNTLCYNVIIWRIDWPSLIRSIKERNENEAKLREELAREHEKSLQGDDDYKAIN